MQQTLSSHGIYKSDEDPKSSRLHFYPFSPLQYAGLRQTLNFPVQSLLYFRTSSVLNTSYSSRCRLHHFAVLGKKNAYLRWKYIKACSTTFCVSMRSDLYGTCFMTKLAKHNHQVNRYHDKTVNFLFSTYPILPIQGKF